MMELRIPFFLLSKSLWQPELCCILKVKSDRKLFGIVAKKWRDSIGDLKKSVNHE